MTNKDYSRLPPRIRDEQNDFLVAEDRVRGEHSDIAAAYRLSRVRTAPLGLAATFRKGSQAAGEKVMEFTDLGGRKVMLPPDSTPALLRYHLETTGGNREGRYAFLSPVFRHRKGLKRRAAHHLGFATIDSPVWPGTAFNLVDLAGAMALLLHKLCLPFSIRLTDFGMIRSLMAEAGVPEERAADDVFHAMRPLGARERTDLLRSQLRDCPARDDILLAVTSPVQKLEELNPNARLREIGSALEKSCGEKVLINTADLHASELIDGAAVRFVSPPGGVYGDGGEYGKFARSFDPKFKSLVSVACGMEVLTEQILEGDAVTRLSRPSVTILVIDSSPFFALSAANRLRSEGYCVAIRYTGTKLGKALRQAVNDSSHFAVIGADEEATGSFSLRCRESGKEMVITP